MTVVVVFPVSKPTASKHRKKELKALINVSENRQFYSLIASSILHPPMTPDSRKKKVNV